MRYRLWIFNLEQLEMVNSHQISTSLSYKHFKNESIKQLTLSRMWVKGRSIGQYQNACLACVLEGHEGGFSTSSTEWIASWRGQTARAAFCALAFDGKGHQLPVCVSLTHFYSLFYSMSCLSSQHNKQTTAPGLGAQNLPNGYPRYPSFGDASSHPSSRHPSVGSARLPSVGEESTHPLLVAEEQVRSNCVSEADCVG